MPNKNTDLVYTPEQYSLFHVEKQAEIDGIEMGVLENGLPYLTQRGLARMCGIDNMVLHRLAANWAQERKKPRGRAIDDLLQKDGYAEESLYLKSDLKGTEINAYTEPVCLALLEYYAFLTDEPRQQAITAYRALARRSFREFIYAAVGYAPNRKYVDSWTHFHDRIDMTKDKAPLGYFGVFPEIGNMIVPMIRAGILVSEKIIPDISVGKCWSAYWQQNDFDNVYGKTTTYEHEYPDYYPQAKSNPQTAKAYPNGAWGVDL